MKKKSPKALRILITAGPTVEPIDPVRFLSNYSTGAMGYAIAEEATNRGLKTFLVTGPVNLTASKRVKTIKVETAQEMHKEVTDLIKKVDCIVMAAAVGDFKVKKTQKNKIKKKDKLVLELEKNPDILTSISKEKDVIKVGFALETEKALKNGKKKLKEKNLDLIIINTVGKGQKPFGPDKGKKTKRKYMVVAANGQTEKIEAATKKQMAKKIIKRIKEINREK